MTAASTDSGPTGPTQAAGSTAPISGSGLPVLVLDFDGTICLGDGPIWAYANGVLPHLDAGRAAELKRRLAAYLAGDAPPGSFADGYSAVVRLAGPGVLPAALDAAYRASRDALAAGLVKVHAPDGLPELLADLAGRVRRVLMTNAPGTGLDLVLGRLGLADRIDEVVTSAHKPDGFAVQLPRLLGGMDPARLMSVGDLWANDIAPPLAAGCATGFVDFTGADTRPAHATATSLPGLYPAMLAWADDPIGFTAANAPRPNLEQNRERTLTAEPVGAGFPAAASTSQPRRST